MLLVSQQFLSNSLLTCSLRYVSPWASTTHKKCQNLCSLVLFLQKEKLCCQYYRSSRPISTILQYWNISIFGNVMSRQKNVRLMSLSEKSHLYHCACCKITLFKYFVFPQWFVFGISESCKECHIPSLTAYITESVVLFTAAISRNVILF